MGRMNRRGRRIYCAKEDLKQFKNNVVFRHSYHFSHNSKSITFVRLLIFYFLISMYRSLHSS